MSALRELIAFFGVDVDDSKLDSSGKKMEGLVSTAERAAAAIGLAFSLKEVTEFVTGQIEAAATLAHTSEMLGLTVGDLQAFQYAASTAGVSAEEASNAVRFLNRNVGEAAKGGGDGAKVFTQLGVHLKDAAGNIRPTNDILSDVADGFTKLKSPAEKTAVAMGIFGRAGARMIPLLSKGSAGIDELNKEFEDLGGGIDEEFVAQAEEGEHALARLSLVGKGLASTIASALLPMFMGIVDWLVKTVAGFREFAEHSYIVETALGTLGAVAAGLIVVWGALNFEILLVVVAVALLVLAVDDVYTALRGGNSVIGDFVDELFGIGATNAVFAQLKTWIDEVTMEAYRFVDALEAISAIAKNTENNVAHALHLKSDDAYDADKKLAQSGFDKAYEDFNARQAQLVADHQQVGLFQRIDQNENAYAQQVDPNGPNLSKQAWYHMSGESGRQAALQDATVTAPPGAAAAASGPVTKNVTNNVTNNVTGSSDPKETAKLVGKATTSSLNGDDDNEDDFAGAPTGGRH